MSFFLMEGTILYTNLLHVLPLLYTNIGIVMYTCEGECLFLHSIIVGRHARVVALEIRHESHYNKRGGGVVRPPFGSVLLNECQLYKTS